MNSSAVEEAVQLASSLDPQVACVAARGWGLLEEVCELCSECVGEGGEWAVQVMREVVTECSDTQLVQNCQKWRIKLATALQCCSSTRGLRLLCLTAAALVSRAHHSPSAVRDFSTTSLPPLLSPLLRFQESPPPLQSAVLPCLSTIHHLYPASCKPHRSALLSWGKVGLLSSDVSLSRESARLLVVMHSSCDQWCALLNGSLSSLSSSLLHFSHTLTHTTPLPDKLNLDLPSSEPERSVHLLRLISSHCRLLCYLLLSPPPSPLTLPLSTLVGVVSFGLHIGTEQAATIATDSTLLLSVLPALWSSLLSLLHSLLTSTHHHLLPYTSTIDSTLLRQMNNKGGVVWQECVHGAVCAWVKLRGEGGKGDKFSMAVVHLLLQLCQSQDQRVVVQALKTLCHVLGYCGAAIQPHTAQLVWQVAQNVLSTPSSEDVTLAGVRLLQSCLVYPNSTPLSVAIRIFQSHTHHTCEKICNESRRGLITCGLLMHPRGPPWYIGDPEFPPMRRQGPHLGTGPLTPGVEDGMDIQPSPMTNVNLLTQSVSKSPALHSVMSRKRRHPDEGEGEEDKKGKGEDEGGGEGEITAVVSGGSDVVHSPAPVGIHGETSGHHGPVGTDSQEDSEERREDGGGEEGMVREESGDSDVEDILATFCSSPASDCS